MGAMRHGEGLRIADWPRPNYSHVTRVFRLNGVGHQFEGPVSANVFVEHKDLFGLTVCATGGNRVNDRSHCDRIDYADRRNSAPNKFIAARNGLVGLIFSLTVRGTF